MATTPNLGDILRRRLGPAFVAYGVVQNGPTLQHTLSTNQGNFACEQSGDFDDLEVVNALLESHRKAMTDPRRQLRR